jgi:hypothetical protein
MKKTHLNFIKLFAFAIVIFLGFLLSNNQFSFAAKTFDEPRVADWRSASMIRMDYGTNATRVENEGDIEFFFDPAKSVELNKVVFRERKNDLYLVYEQDATTAYIEGSFENDTVPRQAISQTQNYTVSTIQDSDGELCGITKTTNCQPGGEDRDFYNGPAPDLTKFLESLKTVQEKEAALSQCENNPGIPLTFITCPLLEGINNTIGALIGGDGQVNTARKGLLVSFLQLPPINSGDTGSVLSQVVGNVVNIANIFYILIFIILIFASSIPFLNLDSYTIKKTLPKFIAAVILTQFSIQICGIIVDFFNLLGLAIPNIIFGLVDQVSLPLGTGVAEVGAEVGTSIALVAGAGALVGVVAFAPVIIIILAIMALVAALIAVFYIMVRFFLLYVMIIISPLAFAAWVLPGTEKFFKQWWTNFIKLNAMFVTIMGLLSISILLSLIFRSLGSEGGNTVTTLLSGVIPIIALILVPKTLKWTTQGMNALAAGALNAVGGAGGKATGSLKGKATGAAKGGVKEQQNKAVGLAFGSGKARTAALLGGRLPTRRGQFEAGKSASGYNAEQRKVNKESLEYQGSTMDFREYQKALRNIASGKGSSSLGASRPDRNMRISAGNLLAQQGDVEHIRAMRNGGTAGKAEDAVSYAPGTIDDQTLSEIIQPSFGDIKSAAPDLTKGGQASAFYGVSTSGISKLDASSIAEYTKHLSGPAPTDLDKLKEFNDAKASFDARIKDLHASDYKDDLKSGQIDELNKYAASAGLGVTF